MERRARRLRGHLYPIVNRGLQSLAGCKLTRLEIRYTFATL